MARTAWLLLWFLVDGLVGSRNVGAFDNDTVVEVRETHGTPAFTEKRPNTLQISFDLKGREVQLNLKKTNILTRDFAVTFAGPNDTAPMPSIQDVAFYQDKHTGAAVAVTSLEQRGRYQRSLEGTFLLDDVMYSMEPKTGQKRSTADDVNLHLVSPIMTSSGGHVDSIVKSPLLANFGRSTDTKRHRRQTNTSVYDVEMRIVADFTVWEHYMGTVGQNEEDALAKMLIWYAVLTNQVDYVYSTIDSVEHGFGINIWLKELHIAKTQCDSPWVTGSSVTYEGSFDIATDLHHERTLEKLARWTMQDERDWTTADVTVLCTRYDLNDDGDSGNIGVAYSSGICSPKISTAVLEDRGYSTTYRIVAHELGHLLGARHDTTDNCPSSNAIMSPSPQGSTFSDCSINAFGTTLSGEADGFPRYCLMNKVCSHETNAYQACVGDPECLYLLNLNGEPDENCEETSIAQPVPTGCEDNAAFYYSKKTCQQLLRTGPHYCTMVDTVAAGCCRSCHEAGLVA